MKTKDSFSLRSFFRTDTAEVTLKKLSKLVREKKREGWTDLQFKIYCDEDGENLVLNLEGMREETDQERLERVRREALSNEERCLEALAHIQKWVHAPSLYKILFSSYCMEVALKCPKCHREVLAPLRLEDNLSVRWNHICLECGECSEVVPDVRADGESLVLEVLKCMPEKKCEVESEAPEDEDEGDSDY